MNSFNVAPVSVDVALAAANVGIKVFPLVKGTKFPHGKDQHPDAQKADATVDEAQIKAWAARFPGCNWGGLVPADMVLIDVDLPDGGGANAWLAEPGVRDELGNAFVEIETPSGGRHYLFAQPEPGRWVGGNGRKETVAHVDVRAGDAFYFVLPGCWAQPKFEGDGQDGTQGALKPYRIARGKLVESLDLTAPGAAISAFLDRFYRAGCAGSRRATSTGFGGGGAMGAGGAADAGQPAVCLDSLSSYINTDPGWQQVALKAFMNAEGVNVCESGADGVVRFQRPGSGNPWGATWGTREGRHGATGTAKKALGFPRLYVWSPNWKLASEWAADGARKGYSALDLLQLYYQDDHKEMDELMHDARVSYHNATMTDEDFHDEPNFDYSDFEPSIGSDGSGGIGSDSSGSGTGSKSGSDMIDAHEAMALDVISRCREGGFLRTFWREMERIEFRPQPVFRLAGGLVALSALIGRKVATSNGEMSNLLCTCVAQTGMGKESARSLVARLMDTVLPGVTATGSARAVRRCGLPHSGSGLFNVLAQSPARVMVADEIGALLEAGAKDQNGLQGTLMATLVETYTTGTGWMHPRERADRVVNTPPVQAPFLSMLGFTQPEKMDTMISAATIELGLVPRMLIFRGRNGVRLKDDMDNVNTTEIPRELVDLAQSWQDFEPPQCAEDPSRLTFACWAFSEKANDLVKVMVQHFEGKLQSANSNGSATAAVFTRAVQAIKRLSLVFAADRMGPPKDGAPEGWTVEHCDVYNACEVVNASIENVTGHIKNEMSTGDIDAVVKKVEKFLRKNLASAPEKWFTVSEIAKKVRHRLLDNARDRVNVFKTLIENGTAEMKKINIRGIERLQYRGC